MKHICAFVKSSLHLDTFRHPTCLSLSRCSPDSTRRAANSSHIGRDPVGVKTGCPGGCSRAPQGSPETYGRLRLWRVGCGESCGGRTGPEVARTAHDGTPRHKRPIWAFSEGVSRSLRIGGSPRGGHRGASRLSDSRRRLVIAVRKMSGTIPRTKRPQPTRARHSTCELERTRLPASHSAMVSKVRPQ